MESYSTVTAASVTPLRNVAAASVTPLRDVTAFE